MVPPAEAIQIYDTSGDMISGVQIAVDYNDQPAFDSYDPYDEYLTGIRRSYPRLLENSTTMDTTSDVLELEMINEVISPECIDFCEAHGLAEDFDCCLQKIKSVFKDASRIEAELNYFCDEEEMDEEPHISIEVTLNATWETAESYYEEWLSWFVENVSDSIRKYFILTTNRE